MQRLVARLSGRVAVGRGSMPPPLGAVLPAVMRAAAGSRARLLAVRSTGRDFLGAAERLRAEPLARRSPPFRCRRATPCPGDSGDPAASAVRPSCPSGAPACCSARSPRACAPARRRRGPVTFEAAKHEAEEAADRDALLDLFFDFSRQFFDYAAMFLVHGDIAEGRDAFGVGASRERVVGIGVPARSARAHRRRPRQRSPRSVTNAPADGLDAELLARPPARPRDAEMAIVPLVVRTRAVAILVGDCGDHGVDRASVQQVVAFAGVIGQGVRAHHRPQESSTASSPGSQGTGATPRGASTRRWSRRPAKRATRRPPLLMPVSLPGLGPAADREHRLGPPDRRVRPSRARSRRTPRRAPARRRPADAAAGPPPARAEPPPPVAVHAAPPVHPSTGSPRSAPLPVVTAEGAAADAGSARAVRRAGLGRRGRRPPAAALRRRPSPCRRTGRRSGTRDPPNGLPSVIVDIDRELAAIVERLAQGVVDEQAEGELLRQGERAMRVIMAHFPGPLDLRALAHRHHVARRRARASAGPSCGS